MLTYSHLTLCYSANKHLQFSSSSLIAVLIQEANTVCFSRTQKISQFPFKLSEWKCPVGRFYSSPDLFLLTFTLWCLFLFSLLLLTAPLYHPPPRCSCLPVLKILPFNFPIQLFHVLRKLKSQHRAD